jgi:hypothetical protein
MAVRESQKKQKKLFNGPLILPSFLPSSYLISLGLLSIIMIVADDESMSALCLRRRMKEKLKILMVKVC